ncbi:MAG: hypothetical protein GTO51_01645 [Candidatus Latescibacteria bacterium]|nr:hypothetical protein [Candidatus Latescibacterota bacterium]NIM22130.1 hypothetical protein [Candidatus Latescibacterota bacterium]NIM64680.1 hypothetical protein [Candidatus Latescibacterota bacterium]NIO01190.1 hypothetical protein [Candidatus Latescibacterota bacterium]NIO27575.1 hypothetical protein [Candidatus Latescibacterota bacterium]
MRFVVCFCLFLISSVLVTSSFAQLRLNEILADPASDWDGDGEVGSKADEWVEIINVGTTVIDLSKYRLTDLSGSYNWRYAFSGTLGPAEIAVVYGSEVVRWQSENGISTYGLSLNNSGDTVYLYEVSVSDTVEADRYAYLSHEVLDDRAVGRRPDGTGDWVIFDGLNPYSGTKPPPATGCNPSPGMPVSCATPVEKITWGIVKTLYLN